MPKLSRDSISSEGSHIYRRLVTAHRNQKNECNLNIIYASNMHRNKLGPRYCVIIQVETKQCVTDTRLD